MDHGAASSHRKNSRKSKLPAWRKQRYRSRKRYNQAALIRVHRWREKNKQKSPEITKPFLDFTEPEIPLALRREEE